MEQMIIPQMQELDRKQTQAAVDDALEKYRFFKTITFEVRETTTAFPQVDRGRRIGTIRDPGSGGRT